MRSEALEDLFVQEIEELYDAEKQIYKGLSLLQKSASSPDLKSAFTDHQKETKDQIKRLEHAFRILGEKPRRGDAAGVSGLIRQSKQAAGHDAYDRAVEDAALITAAQKIEHYEIAAYGCVRTHAGILGYKEIEELMGATLQEEEEADARLTQIAEKSVNPLAAGAPYAQARTGTRHATTHEKSSNGKLSLGTMAVGLAIGGAISLLLKNTGQGSRYRPS